MNFNPFYLLMIELSLLKGCHFSGSMYGKPGHLLVSVCMYFNSSLLFMRSYSWCGIPNASNIKKWLVLLICTPSAVFFPLSSEKYAHKFPSKVIMLCWISSSWAEGESINC